MQLLTLKKACYGIFDQWTLEGTPGPGGGSGDPGAVSRARGGIIEKCDGSTTGVIGRRSSTSLQSRLPSGAVRTSLRARQVLVFPKRAKSVTGLGELHSTHNVASPATVGKKLSGGEDTVGPCGRAWRTATMRPEWFGGFSHVLKTHSNDANVC